MRTSAGGTPSFSCSRAQSRRVIAGHVEKYYASLPDTPRIGDLAAWFAVCQWNARAEVYEYFVAQIRKQCEAAMDEPCTATDARRQLARILGKSLRQVERYCHLQPVPKVSGNGNGNRNGAA